MGWERNLLWNVGLFGIGSDRLNKPLALDQAVGKSEVKRGPRGDPFRRRSKSKVPRYEVLVDHIHHITSHHISGRGTGTSSDEYVRQRRGNKKIKSPIDFI